MLLRQPRRIILIVVILQAAALLSYAVLGAFSRMMADDYCNAVTGLRYGPFAGVQYQYQIWSGRYTGFFIEFSLAPAQPLMSRIFPVLMLITWVASLWIVFFTITKSMKLQHTRVIAGILSVGMAYVLVNTAPSPQNIYWYSALVPYVLSVHILFLYAAFLLNYFQKDRGNLFDLALIVFHAIFTFLMAGFTEVSATFLITVHGLALGVPFVIQGVRSSLYWKLVLAGLLTGIIGLGVMVSAPGIAIRREAVEALTGFSHVTLPQLMTITIRSTGLFLFVDTFGLAHMLFVLFAVFVGTMIYYLVYVPEEKARLPENPGRVVLFIVVSACLLIMSVLAPSIYGHGHATPRSLVLARVVQMFAALVLAYMAAAWVLRKNLHHRIRRSILYRPVLFMLMGMMICFPIITLVVNFSRVEDFHAYANGWDERHQILQNAELDSVVNVPDLGYNIETYLDLDYATPEGSSANSCMANFYGLEDVTVFDLEESSRDG